MSGICKQGQPLSLESIKYRQVMKPDCPNKDNQAFINAESKHTCKLLILEFCFPQKVPTATANSTLLGARHALEEINADPAYPFQLRARHINPAGELAAYSEAVSTFIAHGIRHIFGTITSASRKEIILTRAA